jgi:ABC-type phosphate/phosphonate transport system substrate-binding protein
MRAWTVAKLLVLGMGVAACSGCRSFINVFDLKPTVRMALVTENPLELLNPFTPWEDLLVKLREETGQPVSLTVDFPFVAGPQLQSGAIGLAVVAPRHFVQLPDHQRLQIVAAPSDSSRPASRPAVLLVRQDDESIENVADLGGKRVAFGDPADDRTYRAPLALLSASGLVEQDLAFDLLGPGRHQRTARLRLMLLLEGKVDAVFVDEADWNELPATSAQPQEPAQVQFRVVAQTIPVPKRLIVASPELEADRVETIRRFLLAADQAHPEVLRPLDCAGFWTVPPAHIEQLEALKIELPEAAEAEAALPA